MDPKEIRKRIEDLKARRIPAADLSYELAAALWECAIQLSDICEEISGK